MKKHSSMVYALWKRDVCATKDASLSHYPYSILKNLRIHSVLGTYSKIGRSLKKSLSEMVIRNQANRLFPYRLSQRTLNFAISTSIGKSEKMFGPRKSRSTASKLSAKERMKSSLRTKWNSRCLIIKVDSSFRTGLLVLIQHRRSKYSPPRTKT